MSTPPHLGISLGQGICCHFCEREPELTVCRAECQLTLCVCLRPELLTPALSQLVQPPHTPPPVPPLTHGGVADHCCSHPVYYVNAMLRGKTHYCCLCTRTPHTHTHTHDKFSRVFSITSHISTLQVTPSVWRCFKGCLWKAWLLSSAVSSIILLTAVDNTHTNTQSVAASFHTVLSFHPPWGWEYGVCTCVYVSVWTRG